jgi:hypothetical protein
MYLHVLREFAPKIGLAGDLDRLEKMVRERISRG